MTLYCAWWKSWLSDQSAFSNSESDVVWRVSRLPPWLPSWILGLKDLAILNLHVTPMPSIRFWLNLTYCLGGDVVWGIQDGHHGGHLGYWNRMILAILNFHNTPMPPIKFKLNRLTFRKHMWFENFQDGCHCGYQNGTILAILNLHAVPMPFTKFPLHPTYCSGADNNWRLSKWPPWQPSWIGFWWVENVKSYWWT